MRLTNRIWRVLSGGRAEIAELPTVNRISPRLPPRSRATASRTEAHIARPSMTPSAIVSMRPSTTIMSAACLAAAVPSSPSAMPTSARRIAGASLAPSPVTATTCPARRSDRTTATLCAGLIRAKTDALDTSASMTASSASAEFRTDDDFATGEQIEFGPIASSGARMVAGEHDDLDARAAQAPHDRFGCGRARRVGQSQQPAQLEPLHTLVVEMLAARGSPFGDRQHPQAPLRQPVDLGFDLAPVGCTQWLGLRPPRPSSHSAAAPPPARL